MQRFRQCLMWIFEGPDNTVVCVHAPVQSEVCFVGPKNLRKQIFVAQHPLGEVKALFLVWFVDPLMRCYMVWMHTKSLISQSETESRLSPRRAESCSVPGDLLLAGMSCSQEQFQHDLHTTIFTWTWFVVQRICFFKLFHQIANRRFTERIFVQFVCTLVSSESQWRRSLVSVIKLDQL